jgi:hypothetical protein
MGLLKRLKRISKDTDWKPTFVEAEDWEIEDDSIELLGPKLHVQLSYGNKCYTVVEALDDGSTRFSMALLTQQELLNYLQAYHKCNITLELTPDNEICVYVECGDMDYEGKYIEGNELKRMPDTIEWQECPSFYEYLEDRIKENYANWCISSNYLKTK